MRILLVMAGVVIVFLGVVIYLYNKLVQVRMMVQEAWSGVDVQLKRRHDLIPNLVAVVKAYAGHERQTLQEIASFRAQVVVEGCVGPERSLLENGITRSLKTILAIAEAYPDLKADHNFLKLHESLVTIEDDIQLARRYYNGSVRNLNLVVQSFPGNIAAALFAFHSESFFELPSVIERETPKVEI